MITLCGLFRTHTVASLFVVLQSVSTVTSTFKAAGVVNAKLTTPVGIFHAFVNILRKIKVRFKYPTGA